jgi:hypothetical protein
MLCTFSFTTSTLPENEFNLDTVVLNKLIFLLFASREEMADGR